MISAQRRQNHTAPGRTEVPGDGAGGLGDRARQLTARGRHQQPFRGTDHADRADHGAVTAQDRRRDTCVADGGLLVLYRVALLAHLGQRPAERHARGFGPAGQRGQVSGHGGSTPGIRKVGHDGMPQRAGMPRDRRTHLQDLHGVVRAEHVVQHNHPITGQTGHPDRLVRPLRERLRPQQGAGAQLRAVEVGVTQREDGGAETVLPGVGVLGDQVVLLQRAQQPMHCGLGQAGPFCDLGDAETGGAGAENGQNPGRALHRLDHDNLSAMPNTIQDIP